MISSRLEEFLLCLQEQRFYDAHEVFEEIWFPRRFEKNDELFVIKGFINASVCFELYKRGRHEQCKRVWKNYLKYRAYIFKINSKNQNLYYQLSRHLETIYNSKNVIIKRV